MFRDLGRAIAGWKAWNRLKEAAVKGNLLTSVVALGGAIATALVAKYTTHCPDLFANAGAILTTGVAGAWAFLRRRESVTGSLVIAVGAAGIAAMASQIRQLCGPDFFTVAPTIATSAVWVGVMAWLKSPKE